MATGESFQTAIRDDSYRRQVLRTKFSKAGWIWKSKTDGSARRQYRLQVPPANCCCPVSQLCLTLCYPMHCSTPGFPVLHCLLDFAETHLHWVSDAVQPSHPPLPRLLQPLILPSARVFSLSQVFASSGQSIGASALASVFPVNIQGWFPLGLTGLITLQSKGLSRVFSSTTIQEHQLFGAQTSLWSSSHICTTTRKAMALTIQIFVSKVMSLHFNTLSRLIIAFLPRSKLYTLI